MRLHCRGHRRVMPQERETGAILFISSELEKQKEMADTKQRGKKKGGGTHPCSKKGIGEAHIGR